MFRKLMDLLFKEEEFVEEDEVEVEPITLKSSSKKTEKPAVIERENPDVKAPKETVILERSEQSIQPADSLPVDTVSPKVSSIKRIDVDTEEVEEVKVRLMSEPESEYEFTPVISPIYGMTQQEGYKPPKPLVKQKNTPKEESTLDTIISPYYGKINQPQSSANAKATTENNPNLSLEEMLSDTPESSDAVQVSLFDDSENEE